MDGSALGLTFSDNFSLNPGINWCERWHHVLWDSTNFLVKGVNGDNCCHSSAGPVGCCAETCSSCGVFACVNSHIFGHELITASDYTGSTRTAEIVFIHSDALTESEGEHVALFADQHPNCHAGFQATIFRKAIAGNSTNHILRILRTSDATTGYPECSGWPGQQSVDVNVGTLVTGTSPRYKLQLSTTQVETSVSATATLIDTVGNVTLGTVTKSFGKPSWYNQQAKRFGFGGVFGSVCQGGPTPGIACNAVGDCGTGGSCVQSASKVNRIDNFVRTY